MAAKLAVDTEFRYGCLQTKSVSKIRSPSVQKYEKYKSGGDVRPHVALAVTHSARLNEHAPGIS